ncbi:MAG: hypothetical protein WA892_01350, partial [Ornithinimicrobium sp.]
MIRLPSVSVDGVASILNEYGSETRRIAGEEDGSRPRLGDLGAGVAELAQLAPTTSDLQAAADALHPLFVAAEDESGPAAILNDL